MEKLTLENISCYLPYGLKVSVDTFYNTPDNEPLDKSIDLGAVIATFDSVNRSEHQWIGISFEKSYGLVGRNILFDQQWRVYKDFYTPERVKPILRPMSDLTKPIIIEGKEVTPIVELAKIAFPECEWFIAGNNYKACRAYTNNALVTMDFGFNKDCKSFWVHKNTMLTVRNQFHLFQKLAEWKFDFHNLIGQNLAIDINTLETNPYNN